MNHTPAISIIVPVYNAEKYLKRCLDSIADQTFTDFEVILIDDGSQDKSGFICDEYVKKYQQFKVIHKVNEGVSIARQTGLDASKGEFVIHADPDDRVEPVWLETVYEKIRETNADMVFCDFDRVSASSSTLYKQTPTSLNNDDLLEDLLEEKIWGPCWNKLIRRDCFIKNNIRFVPEMNLWEDLYVHCKLLLTGIKVEYVPKCLYHYDVCSNDSSIVRTRKLSHINSAYRFIADIEPFLSGSRYKKGWFLRKSLVKKWIFQLNPKEFNVVDTFKEINEDYIKKFIHTRKGSVEQCVALSLKGCPIWLSQLLFKIRTFASKVKKFLR